jgi:hypothetical protein
MTFLSPFDDLVVNTLAAIPGWLAKLQYLSRLRGPQGEYAHWGLARLHGDAPAHRAALDAHQMIFSQILRTPLAALLEDAGQSSTSQHLSPGTYVETLSSEALELAPHGIAAAAAAHFSSVLHALSSLAKAPRANQPTS